MAGKGLKNSKERQEAAVAGLSLVLTSPFLSLERTSPFLSLERTSLSVQS